MNWFELYTGFMKYMLTNNYWWFGFLIGAIIFFILGINWNKMDLYTQWWMAGAVIVINLIGIWTILKSQ